MARTEWSLQDAKNSFSAVVDAACKGTPQTVTKRGKPAVGVRSWITSASPARRRATCPLSGTYLRCRATTAQNRPSHHRRHLAKHRRTPQLLHPPGLRQLPRQCRLRFGVRGSSSSRRRKPPNSAVRSRGSHRGRSRRRLRYRRLRDRLSCLGNAPRRAGLPNSTPLAECASFSRRAFGSKSGARRRKVYPSASGRMTW